MPARLEKTNAALALDVGSTRFKLAWADAGGKLVNVVAVPAPRLRGEGLVREVDAANVLAPIDRLLEATASAAKGLPFALVCQRSTFLVWSRDSGRPLTPVVSWQDRRAAEWCTRRPAADALLRRRAGLLLSPHYVGPKLAVMCLADPALAGALATGDALFGNLDSWLTWRWTRGGVHRTDLTMAARTAMVDIETGDWCDELLDLYGVPRAALPEIVASDAGPVTLCNGLRLSCSIADQAAGALTVLDPDEDAALVNLGTGGFVLRPVAGPGPRVAGYLTAPTLASVTGEYRFVLEGTINGAGAAVDRTGADPAPLPASDAYPDALAIPDMNGIGAPHWRPELGPVLSPAARRLTLPADRRRVVVEGLLFRIREILGDIGNGRLPQRVYLSGGLARDPAVAHGLASLLGRPVEVLEQPEATLLGAARLALGLNPLAKGTVRRIEPSPQGAYLPGKFARWAAWVAGEMAVG